MVNKVLGRENEKYQRRLSPHVEVISTLNVASPFALGDTVCFFELSALAFTVILIISLSVLRLDWLKDVGSDLNTGVILLMLITA